MYCNELLNHPLIRKHVIWISSHWTIVLFYNSISVTCIYYNGENLLLANARTWYSRTWYSVNAESPKHTRVTTHLPAVHGKSLNTSREWLGYYQTRHPIIPWQLDHVLCFGSQLDVSVNVKLSQTLDLLIRCWRYCTVHVAINYTDPSYFTALTLVPIILKLLSLFVATCYSKNYAGMLGSGLQWMVDAQSKQMFRYCKKQQYTIEGEGEYPTPYTIPCKHVVDN